MANKFVFNQEAVKEVASVEVQPVVAIQRQPLAVDQELQLQTNVFQAQQALNTEVMLSSNLLKYDLTYKPPTKETFTAPEADQQASIAHIDSLSTVLSLFNLSLKTLQDDVGREEADSNASLQAKTKAFLEKYKDDADVAELFKQEMRDGQLKSYRDIFTARKADTSALKDDSSLLFHSGRLLLKETQTIGNLHNQLLLLQRSVLKRLLNLRDEKQQLAVQITEARRQLDSLNRSRLEDAGDYALAQRLVTDDWQQVESQFQARRAILENYTGLYYVRVRETAAGSLLPDALALRSQAPGDVVPGCADTDAELPDDLTPFMDTVLDIPLADWRNFQNDANLLPSRLRQTQLLELRNQRLNSKVNRSLPTTSQTGIRLMPLLQVNTQILSVFAGKTMLQSESLKQQLDTAHAVLSLEDVLNGSRTLLSGKAQALQQQLTQAAACFLHELAGVRPSIRFRWAQRVEDRKLPVEQPERWPDLADVEKSDMSRVRTLVDLVSWFYRQLADQAGDNSRTAITHLLSACLLIAASDDPEQVLHGNLKTLPGVFRPGELLRLDLNRAALPGQALQLLDAQRQVVGMLRVDDHDQNGTVATLMQVYQPITHREGLSVSGKVAMGRAVVQ
ncbi:hypothetical protein [Methylomonas methanica]|uniref:Uncharacterized protein n=1 Tax=Methylomonas methanica (strain DSM 25384 / MC09) TaxID=857087 RepID=F9ZW19_METMM|nr:hypothetical protein [Methylomonas methanica]AEG00823.1 hypothetical protein Metme_2425 [Methylomonas methanica MC09]